MASIVLPGCEYCVQFDRIDDYDSSYGDWTGTKRFFITRGMTPLLQCVNDLGEANMGNRRRWQILSIGLRQVFPLKLCAHIVNHGTGGARGQSRTVERKTGKEKRKIILSRLLDDTNAEIAYIWTKYKGIKFQRRCRLVGFDAGLTGMVKWPMK